MANQPAPPPPIQADTVDALLETVRGLLSYEDARSSDLTDRATALIGFIGIMLSVAGAFSVSGSFNAALNPVRHSALGIVAIILLIAAFTALIIATVLLVLGVLDRSPAQRFSAAEVRAFPTNIRIRSEKVAIQGRTLNGLTESLLGERARNEEKSKAIKSAYRFTLGGMLAIALEIAILVIEARIH
jgi:hypothetical protein